MKSEQSKPKPKPQQHKPIKPEVKTPAKMKGILPTVQEIFERNGYNPIEELIKIATHPDTPMAVRIELNQWIASYTYKPLPQHERTDTESSTKLILVA